MRNVILVTKIVGVYSLKLFLLIDEIMAIECPDEYTFEVHFKNNSKWVLPEEEFDYVMKAWAPYYKELKEYKDYIENK
jgi:hypothetical protein